MPIDIGNVVHKKEELGLRPWRLCNQFVHLLERWHVWSIIGEMADGVIANVFSRPTMASSHELKQQRRVGVCKIERREHDERTLGDIAVVACMSGGSLCSRRSMAHLLY